MLRVLGVVVSSLVVYMKSAPPQAFLGIIGHRRRNSAATRDFDPFSQIRHHVEGEIILVSKPDPSRSLVQLCRRSGGLDEFATTTFRLLQFLSFCAAQSTKRKLLICRF